MKKQLLSLLTILAFLFLPKLILGQPCTEVYMPHHESFDTWPFSCVDTTGGSYRWSHIPGSGGDDYAIAEMNEAAQSPASFYLTTRPVIISNPAQVSFEWSHYVRQDWLHDTLRVAIERNGSGIWENLLTLRDDRDNFNDLGSASDSPGDFTEKILYLDSALVGDTVRIRFIAATSNYGGNVYLNNVSVEAIPPCPKPTGLSVLTKGSDKATIAIESLSAQFELEYGLNGFTPGAGTITTGSRWIEIGSLSPSTSYDVYVRSYCTSVGDSSEWEGPLTFTTDCQETSIPFYESFDTWPLSCIDSSGGIRHWREGVGSGTNSYAQVVSAYPLYGGSSYITTRPVVLSGASQIRFKWSHKNSTSNFNSEELRVEMEVNGSGSWDSLVVFKKEYGNFDDPTASSSLPGDFVEEAIYLDSSLIGDTIKVRFIANAESYKPAIFLDELYIEAIPICPPPQKLKLNSVGFETAEISFQAILDSFNYEYGPRGYTQGTGTRGSGGNPMTINDLDPGTWYDVYIRTDCDANGTSGWLGPLSFVTDCRETYLPYYESFDEYPFPCLVSNNSAQDWLRYDNFDEPDDYAVANLDASTTFSDYYLRTQPIVIDKPARVRFEWSHGYFIFSNNDELIVEYEKNGEGTWNELLHLRKEDGNFGDLRTYVTMNVPGTFNEEILYLDSNLVGDTVRIRITARKPFAGSKVFINDLYVEEVPPCPAPRKFSVGEVTSESAEISFEGVVSDYVFEYDTSGFIPGTGIVDSSSRPLVFDGLSPNTYYDVYIRSKCTSSGNGYSEWAGPVTFSTTCLQGGLPYIQDFNYYPFECMDSTGGTSSWSMYSGLGGNNHAKADLSSYASADDSHHLTTPSIIVSDTAWLRFKWSHRRDDLFYAYRDTLRVMMEVNNSGTWSHVKTLSAQLGNFNDRFADFQEPGRFVEEIIYLDTALVGDTIKLKFIGNSAVNQFGADIFLDDLIVEKLPPCPNPHNIKLDAAGTDSATISFFSLKENFDYEYDTAGFLRGTGIMGSASQPFTLRGLDPGTNYGIYIRTNCTATGDSTSAWVGPFNFATLCEPISAPYFEDFEDHTVSFFNGLEDCWLYSSNNPDYTPHDGFSWEVRNGQQNKDYNTGTNRDNTLAPAVGGKYLYADNTGAAPGDSTMLYSPLVDISSLSNPELEFYYHIYSDYFSNTQETLYVDIYDGIVWHNGVKVLDTIYNTSENSPYKSDIINLTPYSSSGIVQVRFRCKAGSETGGVGDIAIDDIRISDSITCPRPQALSVSNVETNGAALQWITGGASDWIVEFGPEGFDMGSGMQMVANTDSFYIGGLSPNTIYDFYVRDSCGAGDLSFWSGPFTFRTQCGIFSTPYYDDFESDIDCYHIVNENRDTRSWMKSNYTSISGITSMSMETDNNGEGGANSDYFITPRIQLGQNDSLSFATRVRSSFYSDSLVLLMSTTGRELSDFNTVLWTDTLSLSFDTVSVDLSAYSGTPVYFAFYIPESDYTNTVVYVEDLFIGGGIPFCFVPDSLGAEPEDTEAEIFWTGHTEGNWNIEYDIEGFLKGSGISRGANDDTLALFGLTPETCYDFYVQADCGSASSDWTGPYTFCTTISCPDAGSDVSVTICDTAEVDLETYLSGADPGGNWIDADATGALNGSIFNTASPQVSFDNTYDFWYVMSSGADCENDTAVISMTLDSCKIGLEQNRLEQSLEVYPNPTSTILHINLELRSGEDVHVEVMDLSGKIVLHKNRSDNNGRYSEEVNLSYLAKGTYILRISSGEMKAVRRIVKD